jgi:serine phosphatase RsbU (regulator of sigma subunit)
MPATAHRSLFNDARVSYAVLGALFGFCFPVISTIVDVLVQGYDITWENLLSAQQNQPLHWVINTAPLFLGLFAYLAGRKQHEIVLVNEGLEEQVRLRTEQLSVQNEELRTIHGELADSLERLSQSINYAQRIQDAIVADMHEMRVNFPSSSVFLRPRDVVSGDFPWYLKHGENHYFAAVDCTGHGVPGAFMSIIGYFLLNRIVKDEGITDTGQILCNLHLAVVNLLNQRTDSKMHDGMDLALCRVNSSSSEVQFSGACNPVYHVSNSKLSVYKGDVWSIGGMQYKKRCPYTSQTFSYAEGDSLVMFTDGVSDQFNAEGKLKFGLEPIRKTVSGTDCTPVTSWGSVLEEEVVKWMGDHRQMDDMLMIAVQL